MRKALKINVERYLLLLIKRKREVAIKRHGAELRFCITP